MFKVGDSVRVTHTEFHGVTGVIVDKHLYYRIKFDHIFRGYDDALFKEEEFEHLTYDNISDVLKDYLFNRGWGKNNE